MDTNIIIDEQMSALLLYCRTLLNEKGLSTKHLSDVALINQLNDMNPQAINLITEVAKTVKMLN